MSSARAGRRAVTARRVALAAALALAACSDGASARHDVGSDVRACTANLRAIYDGLLEYDRRFGRPPEESGVAFFAALVARRIWEDAPAARARLTCPGKGARPVPAGTDYARLSALTGESSAYAGRDVARAPLGAFPAGGKDLEPLVACDGALGMNHAGVLNVLYSDGSVRTVELAREIERGALPAGTESVAAGRGSPLPDLRKLVGD